MSGKLRRVRIKNDGSRLTGKLISMKEVMLRWFGHLERTNKDPIARHVCVWIERRRRSRGKNWIV